MNRKTLAAMLALALLTMAACGGDDHANANHANTAANRAAANSNARANTNAAVSERRDLDWKISLADFRNKMAEYKAEADRLGSKIGSGANDLWIWTKVRAALADLENFPTTSVNVDVDNGNVALSGTVENGQQRVEAVSAVNKLKATDDGKDIKNVNSDNLKIASPAR
jgi:osmotically-inducible protein OsmY